MSKISEIFVLKMKDTDQLDAIRETARKDFVSIEGVSSWETLVSTDTSRPTLYTEIFTFPDHATAKKVTPMFAERPATQAFLGQIDEIIVGQFFTTHTPKVEE
ncbi:hypothetical protein Q4544_14970 [Cognatishimia sp. 1_MG-2023]|uniref:hypothetical protein n=1 Tax=Cognatishimia sp. 1_MG-2023 TaxID=3062642 RepID=UPI0026E41830|nr:hypothetical protein [Cognatishimia sp. 1_MG-2023]MDO6728240.1 hypothetical protein [Cognatishimia sp. 1_MG-2023]